MSLFYRMTWIALALSVAMTILSAWIRLADSGIGCAPWPTCFTEQFIVDPEPGIAIAKSDPHRGFRVAHRVMASTFAVVILIMTVVSLWYRRRLGVSPAIPVLCFFLTVVLSVVGINTPDIAHPVVTGINLTGGMLLAALLLHLLMLQQGKAALPGARAERIMTLVGVWLLAVVIASGSWVSGNFAAGQCEGLLACTNPFEANVGDAFDLSRRLEMQNGRIVVDENQAMIAYTHQWLAVLSAVYVFVVAGILLVKWGGHVRNIAALVAGLMFLLMLLGILEAGGPDLFTASLHNALALVLWLALIYLYNCLYRKSEDD